MARRKRKSYTREFKEDAVRLVVEQGYSCREAAADLGGLHSTLISRWVREMTTKTPIKKGIRFIIKINLTPFCLAETESGLIHGKSSLLNVIIQDQNRILDRRKENIK